MSSGDIPVATRQRIRETAGHRRYYLSEQRFVMGTLEIEHLKPAAHGGSDDESNLWLSCGLCNRFKEMQVSGMDSETGEETPLFNPRTQIWSEHFQSSATGATILGQTPVGRVTVVELKLNHEIAVEVRRN